MNPYIANKEVLQARCRCILYRLVVASFASAPDELFVATFVATLSALYYFHGLVRVVHKGDVDRESQHLQKTAN